jgi:dipeptidyl aminopeptidase/acylaminoacyl peptidase
MNKRVLDDGRRRFIGASLLAVPTVAGTRWLAPDKASAQTRSAGPVKHPVVVGYPNKKGIQIDRVTYLARNTGTMIVANVFKPAGFDQSKKYPAIVVTHPFGGVKEQTAVSTPST